MSTENYTTSTAMQYTPMKSGTPTRNRFSACPIDTYTAVQTPCSAHRLSNHEDTPKSLLGFDIRQEEIQQEEYARLEYQYFMEHKLGSSHTREAVHSGLSCPETRDRCFISQFPSEYEVLQKRDHPAHQVTETMVSEDKIIQIDHKPELHEQEAAISTDSGNGNDAWDPIHMLINAAEISMGLSGASSKGSPSSSEKNAKHTLFSPDQITRRKENARKHYEKNK
ncbi:MAG: hypothetical protein SGCHY_005140, partial [Lobulomycetales sp.]